MNRDESAGPALPTADKDDHMRVMSRVLDIPSRPEWEAAVVANLDLLEAAAGQVLAFALSDEIESATVFRPK